MHLQALRIISLLAVGAGALGSAIFLGPTRVARGAPWDTCGGHATKWRDMPVDIHRNSFSISEGDHSLSAFWNGVNQWNVISNRVRSVIDNQPTDTSISFTDDETEVIVMDQAVIDGLAEQTVNGYTKWDGSGCFLDLFAVDIDEADVMISAGLRPFTPGAGNDPNGTNRGRVTFVHEMGHLWGFEDGATGHEVMRWGGIPVTGGPEAATVWPGDVFGMVLLYGDATGLPNLVASSQGIVADGTAQFLDPPGVTACRGSTATATFYIANASFIAVPNYDFQIRLVPSVPPADGSDGSRVVSTFTHTLNSFEEGVWPLPVPIPADLPIGTYDVHIELDPSNLVNERVEVDNATVSILLIDVNC